MTRPTNDDCSTGALSIADECLWDKLRRARLDERAAVVAWIRARVAAFVESEHAMGRRAHLKIDGRMLRIPRVERELADLIEAGNHRSGGGE